MVLPFLHSKSATRTALPHLLPCAQRLARRCATAATSGSACSSPNTTPRHASYSLQPCPTTTHRRCIRRERMRDECGNVLALLDVRGLGLHASNMRGIHRRREACISYPPRMPQLFSFASIGVKAVHDSTPRLPAMSRTDRINQARSVHEYPVQALRDSHHGGSTKNEVCFERSGLILLASCGVDPSSGERGSWTQITSKCPFCTCVDTERHVDNTRSLPPHKVD